MHQFEMRADIRERILARRGRLHIHEQLDAAKTALVVVDMQNAFVDPTKPSAVPEAKNIVSNVNRLATVLRNHGGTVAWVYTTFTESTLTDWNAFFGAVYSTQFSRAVVSNLYDGSDDIHNSDLQVSKNRFSAFLPEACDLKKHLNKKGIDTAIITGTVTNVCCESSARDALMQNFKVLMAHDANAALSNCSNIW